MKRFLVMSAAGHGALIVLLFLTAMFLARPRPGVYTVDLLSSLPSGAPGSAVPVQTPTAEPKPAPAPPKPEIKAPPKEALKIPDRKKKTPPKTKTPPSVKPRATSSAPAASAQPPREMPETLNNGQGGMGGAGIVAETGQSFPYPWYLKAIADKLDEQWHPPENFQPGTACVVRFTIHRDGRVTDATVAKASDDSVFDQLALRAVMYASPLPPLPGGFPEDRLNVHMTFTGKGQ